jgi:hypothetical protein
MRTPHFAVVLLGAVVIAGCTDATIPDLNNPSIEGMTNNPTRAQVQALATGVVMGNRVSHGPQIRDLEIIGRDAYNLDAADPRWVAELLIQMDPGGFGGAHWTPRYRNIKGANVMIASVATAAALSAAEKAAATGFAQTIKAHDLLSIVETRDVAGVAEDAGESTDDLARLLCRDPGLARVAALLDTAQTNLAAGGSEFPFVLPSGFEGFDTPTTFIRFNRALKARTEVYRGKTEGAAAFTRALTALGQSFIDTTASLERGVYHVYSLAAGDIANPLYQDTATTNFRAHPTVRSQAEAGDLRVAAKTAVSAEKTYQGVGSNIIFTVYDGPTSPIPIIRNEELILLRAQANLGLNNLVDASRDINTIRVKSGGLAPRVHATPADALDDLLRQKRYSLLFESGSRWVDARQYNRLNTLQLDLTGHRVHPNYDVPQDEVLARGGTATCQ